MTPQHPQVAAPVVSARCRPFLGSSGAPTASMVCDLVPRSLRAGSEARGLPWSACVRAHSLLLLPGALGARCSVDGVGVRRMGS